MSKDIMDLTREIRIKAAKVIGKPGFVYKPSDRRRDSHDLHKLTLVVEEKMGHTKTMNRLDNIISSICIELNKNDRQINFQNLVNLCDTVLRNL